MMRIYALTVKVRFVFLFDFRCVTFLSDFGSSDETVACCKGMLLRFGMHLPLIDITHDIPPFDVVSGGWLLAAALTSMPVGVHLAIVDPGVGTARRIVTIRSVRGDLLVGPDNGLLLPATERLGGIVACWVVENKRYWVNPVSATFHGRDIMAPVVAALSGGLEPDEVGPRLLPAELVPFQLPHPEVRGDVWIGRIAVIDRYGTLRSNICWSKSELKAGRNVRVTVGDVAIEVPVEVTFADVKEGTPVVLQDSWGYISLALNRASAKERFSAKIGDFFSVKLTM